MSTSEDSTIGSGAQSARSGDGTLLSLRRISKTFGPVRALTDVDLDVSAGEVTALIGDNGAGKSSLIKTVSGLWGPDGGQIIWEGREVNLHSPRDAEGLGITTIYQDLALCENLDIVQNMFLGHELTQRHRHGRGDHGDQGARDAERVARGHGALDPPAGRFAFRRSAPVRGRRQGGHVERKARDHGRAHRGAGRRADDDGARPDQATGVAWRRRCSSSRTTSIDVFEVADRIAVLYLGRLVIEGPAADFDRQSAVEYMTTGTVARAA